MTKTVIPVFVVLAVFLYGTPGKADLFEENDRPQFRHHHEDGLQLCVPDTQLDACQELVKKMFRHAQHGKYDIQCTSAPDKIACIDKIIRGDAHWMVLDPEELYVAHRFLPTNGLAVLSEIRSEKYATRQYRKDIGAVVRKEANIQKLSDLRGKRLCHPGFSKSRSCKGPFANLFTAGELQCVNGTLSAAEKDAATVEKYFGPACLSGPWTADEATSRQLKEKYPRLCELCKDPATCSDTDAFSGYEGALRCLTENKGEVAWSKLDTVKEFFASKEAAVADQYEILCRDGTRVPLNSDKPCSWVQKPWKTFVITNHFATRSEIIQEIQNQTTQLRSQANDVNLVLLNKVLEMEKTDVLYHYPTQRVKVLTPQRYLQSTHFSESLWHPSCGIYGKALRICVYNQVELEKCNNLKLAAIGQRISPGFSCVLGTCSGHCSALVSRGDADLMVTSASVAYKIQNSPRLNPKLVPILREVEPSGDGNTTVPVRYAVAVIRDELADQFKGNLKPLQGKRSCHGSIRNLAGWLVPLSVLRDAGEITGETCSLPTAMSKYFSKLCVPGVPDAKRKLPTLPQEALCSACVGDGEKSITAPNPETVCDDSPLERYQGSNGALKCLTEDAADVAFTDHIALLEMIQHVTKQARPYQLLCRDGTVASLANFKTCNWGAVPTQKVLARDGDADKILRMDARLSLLRAQAFFRPQGVRPGVFKLFGTYYGTSNLIFQNSSLGLQNELSEEEVMRENKIIAEAFNCTNSVHPHPTAKSWSIKEQV